MTSLAYKTAPDPPATKPAALAVEMLPIPRITIHAFCETPEFADVMERVVADRRMSRAHTKVHPGGIAAGIDLYRRTASPNLVLVESRAAIADLHAQFDALAEVCQTSTSVIVIGYANDVAVYRELLARGVSEYIVAPVDPITIVGAISRIYQGTAKSKLGRSVAFVGAKGGVGSSTVANNVASMIARMHSGDVILAELDLPFGSASLDFSLNPAQGIAQALQDPARLDDVLLERLLSKCEDHLSVLTAPATLVQSYDLEESALVRLIELAQTSVSFVVLDVPHIWTSWAKKTLLMADDVVITAMPDLANLRNAKNLVDLLKQGRPNDAPPKLVLNQVGMPKRSEIKPAKFAAALEIESIACIPFEPSPLSTAANQGRMVADVSASSAAAKSFAKIAQAITGHVGAKPSWMSRFAFGSLWRELKARPRNAKSNRG
jgi:pilus assembly protein CpaE